MVMKGINDIIGICTGVFSLPKGRITFWKMVMLVNRLLLVEVGADTLRNKRVSGT